VISILRKWLLKKLMGKNITIFVGPLVDNARKIEVADGKKRVKLMEANVERLTPIRYRLKDYQLF